MRITYDPDLIIPDKTKTLKEGVVVPWNTSFFFYYLQVMEAVVTYCKDDINLPFNQLKPKTQAMILYGSGAEKIPVKIQDNAHTYNNNKPFEGVIPSLERRWRESENPRRREELTKYQMEQPCDACGGYRLKPEALCVKIDQKHIAEVTNLSVAEAVNWFAALDHKLNSKDQEIASRILKEIRERLGFLLSVGLGYLTL